MSSRYVQLSSKDGSTGASSSRASASSASVGCMEPAALERVLALSAVHAPPQPAVGSGSRSLHGRLKAQLHLHHHQSGGGSVDLHDAYVHMESCSRAWVFIVKKHLVPRRRLVELDRKTRQIRFFKDFTTPAGAAPDSGFFQSGKSSVRQRAPSQSLAAVSDVAGAKPTGLIDLRRVRLVATYDYLCDRRIVSGRLRSDKHMAGMYPRCMMVLYHGDAFNLNVWVVMFDNEETAATWCAGLRRLVADTLAAPQPMVVERYVWKQFYDVKEALIKPDGSVLQVVTQKSMKPFIQERLQFKPSPTLFQESTQDHMSFEDFFRAYRMLIDDIRLNNIFSFALGPAGRVDFTALRAFLLETQRDRRLHQAPAAAVAEFVRSYICESDQMRDIAEPHLTQHEFIDFLFSRENHLFDDDRHRVVDVESMHMPLCNYFINSSHNTYITGDQLTSESSEDCYARALLQGCRCIELDCYDGKPATGGGGSGSSGGSGGSGGGVIIKHSNTMVTKLNLTDVLYTIKEYAFVTSEYPVIISIENHCSLANQRVMARELKEILGDYLLTRPYSRNEDCLPSPYQLRKKIIIKNKKLRPEFENSSVAMSVDDSATLDQDEERNELSKTGVLHVFCNKRWARRHVMLFADQIKWLMLEPSTSQQLLQRQQSSGGDAFDLSAQSDDQDAGDDDTASLGGQSLSQSNTGGGLFGMKPEEMHYPEEWFHYDIRNRGVAEKRLSQHRELGNGLFLVRESTTFSGEFTLSIFYGGEVSHVRIRKKDPPLNKDSSQPKEVKYYFSDCVTKPTLYQLITYYQSHTIKTEKFSTRLTNACPQPQPHIGQAWFDDALSKEEAERLLARRHDGAFLIRFSDEQRNTDGQRVFVLSCRVDRTIKHMRLKREGRMFLVHNTAFENLNQLVEYYKTRPFWRGVCLKEPVSKHDGESAQFDPTYVSNVAGEYLNLENCTFVATRDYDGAGETDPLVFAKGAIINFLADLGDGRYEGASVESGRRGVFPASHVKPSVGWSHLEAEAASLGSFTLKPNMLVEVLSWERAVSDGFLADGAAAQSDPDMTGRAAFVLCIRIAGVTLQQLHAASGRSRSSSGYGSGDQFAPVKSIPLPESADNPNLLLLAVDRQQDAEEWANCAGACINELRHMVERTKEKEREKQLAMEFSELIVYCVATRYPDPKKGDDFPGDFREMCSFPEHRLERLVDQDWSLCRFNSRKLSRVYPKWTRQLSDNPNPVPMWLAGVQMAALNHQTADRAMQLHHGKFMANGRCGYVPKPAYMQHPAYYPFDANLPDELLALLKPVNLTIRVIAGRHLTPLAAGRTRGIVSPVCEVEIVGHPVDADVRRTHVITDDGLHPLWDVTFEFAVHMPELALIRFHVEDGDWDKPMLGQAVYPVDAIRPGYRSVRLCNAFGEPLEMAALLVHARVDPAPAPVHRTTSGCEGGLEVGTPLGRPHRRSHMHQLPELAEMGKLSNGVPATTLGAPSLGGASGELNAKLSAMSLPAQPASDDGAAAPLAQRAYSREASNTSFESEPTVSPSAGSVAGRKAHKKMSIARFWPGQRKHTTSGDRTSKD